MRRTTYADEGILDYLISLARPSGYTVGLILGQSCEQKDFVIHLARTSPPSKKDVIEESVISSNTTLNVSQNSVDITYVKSIKDISASWLADHAKHVTRMLPGGMFVLGVFIVGPEDIFNHSACVEKLKAILASIHKNLASNQYLYGNAKQENLILHFNSVTQKCVSKSLDMTNGNNSFLRPVDWKFQSSAVFTKWHHLETLVDFDRLFPIAKNKSPIPLKKQLQGILDKMSDIINSALVIIEGEQRCLEDTVETIGKQLQHKLAKGKKDFCDKENRHDLESEDKILQVGLYIPCTNTISCSASMRLVGQLVSRTFVHQKATIEEAVNAIKQDVIRSLASRLEMHCDSLIEEEDGSPEEIITLHEPPRRVLIQLPRSKVTLSDYLFPGEGAQEALFSLRELLDLQQVQEDNIQKDLELQVDPSEFYSENADMKAMKNDTPNQQQYLHGKKRILMFITGFSFAFLIVIVAIVFNRI